MLFDNPLVFGGGGRSSSAVEFRTLDRENQVTNPLHIMEPLWRCFAMTTTKSLYCTRYLAINCDLCFLCFRRHAVRYDHSGVAVLRNVLYVISCLTEDMLFDHYLSSLGLKPWLCDVSVRGNCPESRSWW